MERERGWGERGKEGGREGGEGRERRLIGLKEQALVAVGAVRSEIHRVGRQAWRLREDSLLQPEPEAV